MTRLIQLEDKQRQRRIAKVDGERLHLLNDFFSCYALAQAAIQSGVRAVELVVRHLSHQSIPYQEVYEARSEWTVLPSFDHPDEPARCLVAGTGLTHKASAENRAAMHAETATVTDSMRMYQWGLDGGRPESGTVGVPPEWFYKGTGTVLRAHNQPLTVPCFGGDGGEEPEIAGVYVIDGEGMPRRAGMTIANEFSDHVIEKKNYLYLAPSKLRTCAIGPELVLDPDFSAVPGTVSIERAGKVIWSKKIATGEAKMSHTVENLEHHHFKYDQHRRPGDVHIHFFGADAFSFGEGIALEEGDVMMIEFTGFGRPLRNPIRFDKSKEKVIGVRAL